MLSTATTTATATSMTAEPVAQALRDEATRVLAPLADLAAPVAPGAEPPWDQLVRVAEHQVRKAADCLASAAYDGDFDGWRAAYARKRVGRAVLERMRRGASLSPGELATAVVSEMGHDGRDGLGQWLGSLGPGGTAAVVRDATTFAVAARAAFATWPPATGTRFGVPFAWDLPTRAVRLEAMADAITGPTRDLLVLATSTVDGAAEQRDLAWLALVATLGTGQLPNRITRIDLASGHRRTVAATDDVLDAGLTGAARAVEAAMAARYTAPAPPTRGAWCRACAGQPVCPAGHARQPSGGSGPGGPTGPFPHGA
ncbi:MAG: hypothetical protein QOI47_345 [Actinomycetota bacterium]|nr:hypothetical protein [Actinomycetota bacterium]